MRTKSIYVVNGIEGDIDWWSKQLGVRPKTIRGYETDNICTPETAIEHYIKRYDAKRQQENKIMPAVIREYIFTYNNQTKTIIDWLRCTYPRMNVRLVQANRVVRYLKLYHKRDMSCINKLSNYELERLLFTKDKLPIIKDNFYNRKDND